MTSSRRSFLRSSAAAVVVLGSGPACGRAATLDRGLLRRVERSRERGAAALWALQAPDGAFRSTTYGLMRGGHSLTPVALMALAACGPLRSSRAIAFGRGLDFLTASLDDEGALGRVGPVTDYPVYATALAVRAWVGGDRPVPGAAARWLVSRQLTVETGWRDHPAEGGFDMGGRFPPRPPDAGHVDLSMTRRALEAMRALGHDPGSPGMAAGERFVSRCAVSGGGFVYSPVEPVLNKAGCDDGGACRAYGSATCDGILALRAILGPERAAAHPLVPTALAALRGMHVTDRNPGLESGPMKAFGPAMRGYYRAGAAEVFRRFGGPEGWRKPLLEAVLAEQREDGSWASSSSLQKEDEPIIATAFALTALVNAAARSE